MNEPGTHLLHVVDAFTDTPFTGNPAAVCVTDEAPDEAWMQRVALEMNLSETAFLRRIEGGWSLRWFTPAVEVKLCGHATLASAHVLWATGVLNANEPARFHTLSGWLTCCRAGNWIEMDFPALNCTPSEPPAGLAGALGCNVIACANTGMDYLVEVADETTLRSLRPDFTTLGKLPVRGVIVTSRSAPPQFDFVSRFFAPAAGVNEDPVTGSAHCALGPYWQAKLNRCDFTAIQASIRSGIVKLSVRGDRVILRGQAVLMSRVELLR
jgi:PhzF family phenazine biosynthesis protein